MRPNLWLPFQLTLVNTLHVGVGVRPTNVLAIHQHMIYPRALFGLTFVYIGVLWVCNSIIHPSIHQEKS